MTRKKPINNIKGLLGEVIYIGSKQKKYYLCTMERLTEIFLDILFYVVILIAINVFPIFIGIINWADIGCNCWNAFWSGFIFGWICQGAMGVIVGLWVFVLNRIG